MDTPASVNLIESGRWRTTSNNPEIGKFVLTFVLTRLLYQLVQDRFTYEERRGRESNPRIDSMWGIYPVFQREMVSHNIIDIGECCDYVVTMPSLRQDSRGRSPFWICCYTAATGQRLQKSTKVTIRPFKGEKRKDDSPKTVADKRAEAWEVCLGIARTERHAKNGTLTEQQAKKIIGEILERTTGEPLHNYKVRDWFAHWLDMKEQVRSGKTIDRYRQVIRDFIASLGNRANLGLAHITPKDVLTYRNSIIAAKKTARTANLSVKVVSAALNTAVRQGYIPSNPATAVESLPVRSEERATFTPAQVAKLVRAANGDWRGAILLGYYTGARLGDVANMRWEAIDWRNKVIRFTPRKTKQPVAVPLHRDLERELLKRAGIGKAVMFPALAGKDTGGRHGLSGRFAALLEKAGIEAKRTQASGGRRLSNLSFHSLRHSFNSAMANAGIAQEIRQKLTGHTSAETNKVYTHHELEPLRAAVGAIPSLRLSAAGLIQSEIRKK